MITINSQFVADATRAHVDRDPRNNVGSAFIDELAEALKNSAPSDRAHRTIDTQSIP